MKYNIITIIGCCTIVFIIKRGCFMYNYVMLVAENSSVKENFSKYAGNVTLSGLIIVFAMLIALVVILSIFGYFMASLLKNNSKPKVEKKNKEEIKVSTTKTLPDENESEIIAAISAAVMMMYDGTGVTPVIRSVRPANKGVRSAWAAAGVANNTRSF